MSDNYENVQKRIKEMETRLLFSKTRNKTAEASLSVVIAVISDLIGPMLVGLSIGYLLHKTFNLSILFFAVFILLGGLAGFLNLYRTVLKLQGEHSNENA